MPDMQHYIAVFSIDGVNHTMRGFSSTPGTCRKHLQQIIDARNANPEMEHEVTKLEKIIFGVSDGEANAIEEQCKSANPNGTIAQDVFPDSPALILHKPVTPVE